MRFHWHALQQGELDHERRWGWIALLLPLTGLLVLGFFGLPSIPCLFREVTGIPCLTCGCTRAVLALSAGEVGRSLSLNPLPAVAVFGAVLTAAYGLLVSALRLPRLRLSVSRDEARVLAMVAVAGVVCVWIYLIAAGR